MNVTVSQAHGAVPVTILHTHGKLDASNYQALITAAEEIICLGVQDILLDLEDTPSISSSGLVALQTIAALLQGQEPLDLVARLTAFRAIEQDREMWVHPHFKLLNTQPRVDQTLEMVGFNRYLEIYTDLEAAVASF
jgi:anti-anti-sigma regulatory factor